jgi:hypothetical protein
LSATRTTLATGTHRAEFIFGELSVGVFVELLQGVGSLGDFNRVDYSVLVGVERFDEWTDDALTTWTSRLASRAAGPSARGWLWGCWSFLCECQDWKCAKSQCDEDAGWFHDRLLLVGPQHPVDGSDGHL